MLGVTEQKYLPSSSSMSLNRNGAEYLKASDSKYTISHIYLYRNLLVPEDFFDTIDPDEEELEEVSTAKCQRLHFVSMLCI